MYSDHNVGRNNLSDQFSQDGDRPHSPHGAPFQRFISNDFLHSKDRDSHRRSQESHSIQAIDKKINNLMNNNKAKAFGSQNKLINKLKQLNQRQAGTPSPKQEIESDLQGYRQYPSEYDEEEEDEEEKQNQEQ